MKVYAPNKQYTGVSASVSFCNGVGETEDPRLLNWFHNHGYEMETQIRNPEEAPEENSEGTEEITEKEAKKGRAATPKAGV
ncbi:hypothetical protein [Lacrimispora sp.]|uniref:hypothetical protein n=1 Tax=Lacrimispora sp. TaxID=2719234 RepID=UPI0028A6CD14|nr:hypothetical protein [Lacrimispora sp.]